MSSFAEELLRLEVLHRENEQTGGLSRILAALSMDDHRLANANAATLLARDQRRCYPLRVVAWNLTGTPPSSGSSAGLPALRASLGKAVVAALVPDVLLWQEAPWSPTSTLGDRYCLSVPGRVLCGASTSPLQKEAGVAWDGAALSCVGVFSLSSLLSAAEFEGRTHRETTVLLPGTHLESHSPPFELGEPISIGSLGEALSLSPEDQLNWATALNQRVARDLLGVSSDTEKSNLLAVILLVLERLCMVHLVPRVTAGNSGADWDPRGVVFASIHGKYKGLREPARRRFSLVCIRLVQAWADSRGVPVAVIGGDFNASLEDVALPVGVSLPSHLHSERRPHWFDWIILAGPTQCPTSRFFAGAVRAAPIYHTQEGGQLRGSRCVDAPSHCDLPWLLPQLDGAGGGIKPPPPPEEPLFDLWGGNNNHHVFAAALREGHVGVGASLEGLHGFGTSLFDHDPTVAELVLGGTGGGVVHAATGVGPASLHAAPPLPSSELPR